MHRSAGNPRGASGVCACMCLQAMEQLTGMGFPEAVVRKVMRATMRSSVYLQVVCAYSYGPAGTFL